jgi:hypothetical protein
MVPSCHPGGLGRQDTGATATTLSQPDTSFNFTFHFVIP